MKKKLYSLAAVWLTVIMLFTVFSISASAANVQKLEFYLGHSKIDKKTNLMNNDAMREDIKKFDVDVEKPLDEMDNIADVVYGHGGDLSGWTLWLSEGSGDLSDDSMKVDKDVVLSDISDKEFEDAFSNYDPLYDRIDTILFVPRFDLKYWFTRQPDDEYPAVETNKPADKYQWQAMDYTEKNVADEYSALGTNDVPVFRYKGTYVTSNGMWESEYASSYANHIISLNIHMKMGEKLIVEMPDGFNGSILAEDDSTLFAKNGNTYTYTHMDDFFGSVSLEISDDAAFEAKIKASVENGWKDISGQTEKLYTGSDNFVRCKATFENEKYTIFSDELHLGEYYIIGQPTEKEPTVTVNKPDKAEKYQWYSFREKSGKFVFADRKDNTDSEIAVNAYDWEEYIDLMNGRSSVKHLQEVDSFVLGKDLGKGWWEALREDPNDITETPTFAFLTTVHKGGKLSFEVRGNDAVQNKIESDATIVDIHDLYNIAVLDVTDFNMANHQSPATPNADGSYTISDETKLLVVIAEFEMAGIDIKPVYDTTAAITKEVEGQNTATFTGKAGSYLAKVTMENGAVLTSDFFTITEENVPSKIPGTADSSVYGFLTLIMLLAAASFIYSARKLEKA